MEVIKHGNTYKEVECKKCNALLSYCESDIKKNTHHDFWDWNDHWTTELYIICPECGTKIELKHLTD